MAVKAYVLITVEPAQTQDVVKALKKVKGVTEVNEVIGPYDIVAEMYIERFQDVSEMLREKIRPISGVRNTLTCVTMP